MKKSEKLGKGESFRNPELYKLKDLGRPAIFLLPLKKIKKKINSIPIF